MAQLALTPAEQSFPTTRAIVAAAKALGAASFGGPLSEEELVLLATAGSFGCDVETVATSIRSGDDPLGNALCALTETNSRRNTGMFYTPTHIVESMLDWVMAQNPARVVDPGCGTGRFASAVVRRDSRTELIAIDSDPVATLACRAVLNVLGATNSRVINDDYMSVGLPTTEGRTAFVGNPPYVRHHRLSSDHKHRAKELASNLGLNLSGLSGLHLHFFLMTRKLAKDGDVGSFITSSEWLDVKYGESLRSLLMDGMGLHGFRMFETEESAFEDAMTTALVTVFQIGAKNSNVWVSTASQEEPDIEHLRLISSDRLSKTAKWGSLLRNVKSPNEEVGFVRLGDIVKVSRGTATGCNAYFVMSKRESVIRGLERFTHPVIHEAKQILKATGVLRECDTDRVVLDPPQDGAVESDQPLGQYLRDGADSGIDKTYLASHRKPWWSLRTKAPPIVATYMARQAPAFALNPDRLRLLNVAHGLYPRIVLSEVQLKGLVGYLNRHRESFRGLGRTYQGGLEKFEPSEMEALLVPMPENLEHFADG